MDNSNYIDKMPPGEYETVSSGPLLDNIDGVQLSGFYSSALDFLTLGNRGQGLTWAINAADLATDPAALQAAYDENPTAINDYLAHVDVDKAIKKATQDSDGNTSKAAWIIQHAPAFFLGGIVAAAGLTIFKKNQN
jgi:hypothetical protein